jgi:creatinine amidohydrolase
VWPAKLGATPGAGYTSSLVTAGRTDLRPFGGARTSRPDRTMSDTILLEEMTWPEVGEALASGRTTAVVAVGAVEQHGPHLPLLVDAARGDRLAVEVARRMDGALVAPTIRVGCSEHHMGFPGTLSLRTSTLVAICTDYVVSLARHGFTRVCLVPSHGGNFGPLRDMLADLRAAVAPQCRVDAYTDLLGFMTFWQGAVEAEDPSLVERVGGHADLAETSEMLCIRPDLVRKERAERGHVQPFDGELMDRIFQEGFRAVTPNGVLGDARGANESMGEACITRAAEGIVAALGG